LKNVFEAADARQKQAKKRSLCVINEHFESVFNTVAATQIVFQRPVKSWQLELVCNFTNLLDCKHFEAISKTALIDVCVFDYIAYFQ
jgi:hypothetical protein